MTAPLTIGTAYSLVLGSVMGDKTLVEAANLLRDMALASLRATDAEPIGITAYNPVMGQCIEWTHEQPPTGTELYARPPAAQWVSVHVATIQHDWKPLENAGWIRAKLNKVGMKLAKGTKLYTILPSTPKEKS